MEKSSLSNSFFVPASKKSKLLKKVDEATADTITHAEVGKSNNPLPKVKRRREDRNGQPTRANTAIPAKSTLKNEAADFFKPILRKYKQALAINEAVESEHATGNSLVCEKKTCISEQSSTPCFDAELEAKPVPEENLHFLGGRPTHPFFAQYKMGQRFSDSSLNIKCSTCFLDIVGLAPLPPFHVTQLSKLDTYEMNWKISKINKLPHPFRERQSCPQQYMEHIELSRVRKLNFLPYKTRRGLKPCGQRLNGSLETLQNFLRDHRSEKDDRKHVLQDEEDGQLFSFNTPDSRFGSLSVKHGQVATSTCLASSPLSTIKNSLWTDTYQPHSPELVCGNKEVVAILSAWLESWKTKCVPVSDGDKSQCANGLEDADKVWFEEDLDTEVTDNVLLLAGPVGSGKTAAVYACAKAQGYTVIEINSSENRNGALIKQRFSEAVESHCLGKWSTDLAIPLVEKREMLETSNSWSNINCSMMEGEQKTLTVMLFEDVDMVFEEDRGFLAALAQLAATTKRPILLTSNDEELDLPHALRSNMLKFKRPQSDELLATAYMICLAEGFSCNLALLREIVNLSQYDIRRTLNFLQFWCQGKCHSLDVQNDDTCASSLQKLPQNIQDVKSLERDSTAAAVLFKLEAQHRLWPAFICVEFPCSATQFIASKLKAAIREFKEKICEVETKAYEKRGLVHATMLEKAKRRLQCCKDDHIKDETSASDSISDADSENGHLQTPVKNLKDAQVVARSPVLRQSVRRQLAIVMSDSDDETGMLVMSTGYHENKKNDTMRLSAELEALNTQNVCNPKESQENDVEYEQISSQEIPLKCRLCSSLHNEVDLLWSTLRGSKEELGLGLNSDSKTSLSSMSSVSMLVDDIGTCDLISSMHQSLCNEDLSSCAENECDDCSQMCACISQTSFQICVQECATTCKSSEEMQCSVTPNDMMLAVHNACMLGKFVLHGEAQLPKCLQHNVGSSSAEQESKRCRRKLALQQCLFRNLPAKALRSLWGSAFHEYSSFIARLGHLGQAQPSLGPLRRRGKACQHYLSTYPWNFTEECISLLQQVGSLGGT